MITYNPSLSRLLTRVRRLRRLHVSGGGEDRRLRGLVLRDEERRAADVVVARRVHGRVPVVRRRNGRALSQSFLRFTRSDTLVQKLSALADFVLSLKCTASDARRP